jgi:hypothetical protein
VVHDGVDYGSARISMPTGIECPECSEKGLCPMCLAPLDRTEKLERVRAAAQFYVNSPKKFGIRYNAYRQLVKALDEARVEAENDVENEGSEE